MAWLKAWRKRVGEAEADAISEAALQRGTLLHSEIESFLKDGVIGDTDDFGLWFEWYRKSGIVETVAIEAQAYNEEHGYAGTIDFIGRLDNGTEIVYDWKTSRVRKRQSAIEDYRQQVSAYCYGRVVGGDLADTLSPSVERVGRIIVISSEVQEFDAHVDVYFPKFLDRLRRFYFDD